MKVVMTGGSGFIGKKLSERLAHDGHTVASISFRQPLQPEMFADCEAVVNLAGEPVAQRWTDTARQKILSSRIEGTRSLVMMLRSLEKIPPVLVSASAIGYYGSRGDEILTEKSYPGTDFLAEVTSSWEREARAAQQFGVRVVTPRIGVVLGQEGGALPKMLPPFRMGVGGKLGSGKQWMSWIHVDDLVALLCFAITTRTLRGAVNAVAPNPVTNAEFTRELAAVLHRPAIIPVPGFVLKLMFGQMSQVILEGQRLQPDAALRAGFQYQFTELRDALRNILSQTPQPLSLT